MSKIKKLIIICIVICIILAIMITALIIIQKNNKKIIVSEAEPEAELLLNNLHAVTDRSIYYAVSSCATKYYTCYIDAFNSNNFSVIASEENIVPSEAVYGMLDEEYIKEMGITQSNILTKLSKISDSEVNIAQIYESDKTANISIYVVKGTIMEQSTKKITNLQVIVELDNNNKAFKILPNEHVEEKFGNIELGSIIEINEPSQIERNSANTYTYPIVDDKTHVMQIFSQYKNYLMYNRQEAYNKLNEEYKNKKFPTIQTFNSYIKTHKNDDITSAFRYWKSLETTEGNVYLVSDTKGNTYVFKEKGIMDYTVEFEEIAK